MSEETTTKEEQKPEVIQFSIDGETFRTKHTQLSVKSLLVDFAKEDPSTSTLALKNGKEYKKFTDIDEVISLKNGMKFIVFHNEPTTVS